MEHENLDKIEDWKASLEHINIRIYGIGDVGRRRIIVFFPMRSAKKKCSNI